MATENVAPAVNSVEETYQKLDQRQHVLKRPDSYVGSVESISSDLWVCQEEVDEDGEGTTTTLAPRNVDYVPALFKIFDEILVNAADNKTRDPENMTWIKVSIDQEEGVICVANNGKGIPIRMHKKEKIFVPELIFGNLLTSDNYNDNKKKVTGGRNGYGAKLCNIFSTKFIVETADASVGKKFVQTFSDNMTVKSTPKITSYTKKDYTKITFWPDWEKFGMTGLDDDTVALFKKRVYDMAGCTDSSVSVFLNGTKLNVKSFKQYVELCTKSLEEKYGASRRIEHITVNDRWDVAICASDGQFEQVSFVNSIWTSKGGTHVDYISDQVAKYLEKVIATKNKKGSKIKKSAIKQFLCVFVRSLIENPAFDSQTKDSLTTQSKAFGSTAELPESFLKSLASKKMGIVDQVMALATFKSRKIGKEGTKAKNVRGVAKLDDANKAGTSQAHKCTLILTEGDSAKTLAVSGLSIVGRDYYGVFPLKGKPLNVREARFDQIAKNDEIQNIIRIMGLKRNVEYNEETIKTLRYGHLMIMADQDHDGSHIKGLIINLIHWYNPSLLTVPGFLQEFITPIVKATKGKKSEIFYTIPQYDQWRETLPENERTKWKSKYYKGLGTSTAAEAKEYFRDLDRNCIDFAWERGDERWIKLAFAKEKANARKTWIENVHGETYVDYNVDLMKYSNFFNKEFVLFSQASVTRAIPALMDGFKPSQRKVLFACFKRNLKSEIKVAQLAGYVSEHAQYHHGEASLMGTIIGMAQNFVGSNNVNLLFPSGQFGTRLMGGSDAASPRYIFTKIANITRTIFHPDDDPILDYMQEDGCDIEPETYAPIIPMALVNGCSGIATGWSTSVPNFNPLDLINNLRRRLSGLEFLSMDPWYNGFEGSLEESRNRDGTRSFSVLGKAEKVGEGEILITELPIGTWTSKYKEFLETLITGSGDKKKKKNKSSDDAPVVKDFQENHTDTRVSFLVTLQPGIDYGEDPMSNPEFVKVFKMQGSISESNMVLVNGTVGKFQNALDIFEAYFVQRMELYEKRKAHMLSVLRDAHGKMSNQARFIKEFMDGDLEISRRPEKDIVSDLVKRGYLQIHTNSKKKQDDDDDDDDDEGNDASGFYYLLNMNIRSLTIERFKKLAGQVAAKKAAIIELENTPPAQIWANDLDALEAALAVDDAKRIKDIQTEAKNRAAAAKKKAKGKKQSSRQAEIAAAQIAQATPNTAAIAKVEVDVSRCEWNRAMAASFQQRRLSVLSPAKGKSSTSSTSSQSCASEFDALFGVTSSKQGGGAKAVASKHTVVISDDDDDDESDADDFETMSLAQRMASVRVSPKKTSPVKDTSLKKVVAKKAIAKKVAAKKTTTSTSAKAKSYAKMKMADLRDLLRERGLKETGRKKADLVARLEEADSQGGGAAAAAAAAAAGEKDFNSPVVSQRSKKCRVSLSPSTVNDDEVEEIDSESSDEESASSSSSSTSGSAPASRARPSRRAAAKKATYVFDDSEEEDDDDFEEEEEDSSFEEGDSEGGWD